MLGLVVTLLLLPPVDTLTPQDPPVADPQGQNATPEDETPKLIPDARDLAAPRFQKPTSRGAFSIRRSHRGFSVRDRVRSPDTNRLADYSTTRTTITR
jgi:hypothetical protein